MLEFNIPISNSIKNMYSLGYLPQRNNKDFFYKDSSSRSDLSKFNLSSENRRILNKTSQFTYQIIDIKDFNFDIEVQKNCFKWSKEMGWDFPTSSIKNIFKNHIFNKVYVWSHNSKIVAYSLVLIDDSISHIAYVFYDPQYSRDNLSIRLVLEVIINSFDQKLEYCYLGRFSKEVGFYKRNMPGFQYFDNNNWQEYK